ncbi:MAG TPA: DUF167 domain-containing protein [Candidatus Paceibacterota bacterium]|nr:DUF167 domain-containing protein [Candidatus Paceibacterota bacterium]
MRIFVKAKPRARAVNVQRVDEENYIVAVTEPPEKGRANIAIEAALAEHFHVPKARVRIVMGRTAREKMVEIDL